MIVVRTEIIVPFHDVDSMNIAWHGHYVKYLEVARCELLELIGYSYQAMAKSGYTWPVVDMRIKYVKPLVFNQRIAVEATLVEWENRLKINYVIWDVEQKNKLTKAHTTQMAIDMKTGESCFESPVELLNCIKALSA